MISAPLLVWLVSGQSVTVQVPAIGTLDRSVLTFVVAMVVGIVVAKLVRART